MGITWVVRGWEASIQRSLNGYKSRTVPAARTRLHISFSAVAVFWSVPAGRSAVNTFSNLI
jgi:hypothetical protein